MYKICIREKQLENFKQLFFSVVCTTWQNSVVLISLETIQPCFLPHKFHDFRFMRHLSIWSEYNLRKLSCLLRHDVGQSVYCLLRHDVGQSVYCLLRHDVGQSVYCLLRHDVGQSVYCLLRHDVGQSVSCLLRHDVGQSVSCLLRHDVGQSVYWLANRLNEHRMGSIPVRDKRFCFSLSCPQRSQSGRGVKQITYLQLLTELIKRGSILLLT
jgi:hypothetical protein